MLLVLYIGFSIYLFVWFAKSFCVISIATAAVFQVKWVKLYFTYYFISVLI